MRGALPAQSPALERFSTGAGMLRPGQAAGRSQHPSMEGKTRAGEAASKLGVLAAPVEGWNWVPSTHMVTHNHLELHSLGMRCPFLASAGT